MTRIKSRRNRLPTAKRARNMAATMVTRPAGKLLVLVGCGLAMAVMPAAASAESLVYIKDDNVWLANEDGTGQYQVTLDGTAGDPYESPSQADDGTIAAIRGSGSHEKIYLMKQNGSLVATPFEPAVEFSGGLVDAAISPDGDAIAYSTGYFADQSCTPGSSGTKTCFATFMSRSDGPGNLGGEADVSDPSWVGNARIMTTTSGQVYLQDVGTNGSTQWFFDTQFFSQTHPFYDGEVAPTGDRLALVEDDFGFPGTVPRAVFIRMWRTNGDPANGAAASVADPTPTACVLNGPAGRFAAPTWADDGGLIAWEEDDGNPATPPTTGQGIWTVTVGNLAAASPSSCPGVIGTPELVIPGGLEPDLGPAPVDPGPRESGGPSGGGPGGGGPSGGGPSGGSGGGGPTGGGPTGGGRSGGGGSGTGGTSGGSGTGTGQPPRDTGAPGASATLAGRAPRLRQALGRGLPVLVSADEACTVTVELFAATRRVGVGTAELAAPGQVRVVAHFTASAKRRYRRLRRVPLTVRVVVTDRAGNQARTQLGVTLRR
jgi:hypothetical protein